MVDSISRYVSISQYDTGSIGSGSTFNSVYKVKVKLGHMRSSSPCLHLLSFRLHRVVQPNKSTARGCRILRTFHTMTAPHSSKFVKEEVCSISVYGPQLDISNEPKIFAWSQKREREGGGHVSCSKSYVGFLWLDINYFLFLHVHIMNHV